MFERFTERARKVMALANQEAQRLNHEFIGTEHILLGLVKEGSGVGAKVLKQLGVDLDKVRNEVLRLVKTGGEPVADGKLPQTPRAKKVLEYAIEEGRNLNHNYVGTEHLLMGLMRETETVAAQVLMNMGLNLDHVRREVFNLLGITEAGGKREAPVAPRPKAKKLKQFLITPAAGKRLIAKAILKHPAITAALEMGTIVIVAGTTNGYVAEEILAATGQAKGFSRRDFYRGLVVSPGAKAPKHKLAGDVVLVDALWMKGKQIFDVVDELKEGDVILKGANAVNICRKQAAVYIGDPKGGTAAAALPAVVGRRVRLIVPVGLEKRVTADIADLADMLNAPGAEGPRLLPLPGEVFTELDAIELLSGAEATLVAGGGVMGAEGAVWIGASGADSQLAAAEKIINDIAAEPPCEL